MLSLITELSARALPTSNITPASLFRVIEKYKPTLLIDEADTFIESSEEMRGIINSGHTRPTAYVIRSIGDNHDPKRFSTWAAKAIAKIGKFPETIHDRSIVIELRRKLDGEVTEKLRHADPELFNLLRSKLKRFANDNMENLSASRPEIPANISERAGDNWEPLLAIASLGGDAWKAKALQAIQRLSSYSKVALSAGTELLADIEEIFELNRFDKISSADLIRHLCTNEERPWLTWNRGKQISSRQIANMLNDYGIRSKTIRLGHQTLRGYELSQFEDAFLRYLQGTSDNDATTPQSSSNEGSSVADAIPVADAAHACATAEPSIDAPCGSVAASAEDDMTDEELRESFSQNKRMGYTIENGPPLDDSLPF